MSLVLRPLIAFFLFFSSFAQANPSAMPSAAPQAGMPAKVPDELKAAGITEKLGDQVAIEDLRFWDEEGRSVPLSHYFSKGKPVALVLAYYQCPSLCTMVLNGTTDALKKVDWLAGDKFEVVTVSINHRENHELAARKKAVYVKELARAGAEKGWHFLTGEEAQIKKLADQVGFGYRWDSRDNQYAHSAAMIVLTPEGKISRYLYGIEYKPKDLKLALLEASNGMIGTVIDRFLLFCYRYDPKTRGYSLVLTKVMQAGSAGSVVVFGSYLAVFWRRQRKQKLS